MSTPDKMNTSLLVDPHRIPYVQMNGRRQRGFQFQWSPCDKALFWTIPLLVFMGISALVFIVAQQEAFLKLDLLSKEELQKGLKWNEVIFTQLWGYSSCLQFKDKNYPREFKCRYENDPAIWSVHGIWPTRAGTEGPNFCSKVKFNETLLEPIRPSLNQFWYEIDSTKEGNHFWSHEWTKHGSCAIEANEFDTELKYFSAGLQLRKQYDLYETLKERDIVPENPQKSSGYSLEQFTDAIQSSFGEKAVPYVQCLSKKNGETGENDFYVLAIQLCFDKDLNFISCKNNRRIMTSKIGDNALPCPENVTIKYLDNSL